MTSDPNFGIILSTYKNDVWLLKPALESIRYFCGDIPIAIIVDGAINLDALGIRYSAELIYLNKLDDPLFNSASSNRFPKMAAFWHSPFEKFLFMDADTIMWGNVPDMLPYRNYDVIIHGNGKPVNERNINHFYFSTPKVSTKFPDVPWKDGPISCTGVFVAKRGIFTRDFYEMMLSLQKEDPSMFFWGEQGYLSLMFLIEKHKGNISIGEYEFQLLHHEQDLDRFFTTGADQTIDVPKVVHFAGNKPWANNATLHTGTTTRFRRRAFNRKGGFWAFAPSLAIRLEDFLTKHIPKKQYQRKPFRLLQKNLMFLLKTLH